MKLTLRIGDTEATVEGESNNTEHEAALVRAQKMVDQARQWEGAARNTAKQEQQRRVQADAVIEDYERLVRNVSELLKDDGLAATERIDTRVGRALENLRSEVALLTSELREAATESVRLKLDKAEVRAALDGLPEKDPAPHWVIDPTDREAGVVISDAERIRRLRNALEQAGSR